MPTSAETTLLETDLMFAGRVARRAVVVALEDHLAAPADEQAVQARELFATASTRSNGGSPVRQEPDTVT